MLREAAFWFVCRSGGTRTGCVDPPADGVDMTRGSRCERGIDLQRHAAYDESHPPRVPGLPGLGRSTRRFVRQVGRPSVFSSKGSSGLSGEATPIKLNRLGMDRLGHSGMVQASREQGIGYRHRNW